MDNLINLVSNNFKYFNCFVEILLLTPLNNSITIIFWRPLPNLLSASLYWFNPRFKRKNSYIFN